MSSGSDEFSGFFNHYDYYNNNSNNGHPNFDSQPQFSDFNQHSLYDSHLYDASASASYHHSTNHQHAPALDIEGAMRSEGRVGLKLTKTPSFLSSLNELGSYKNKKTKRPDDSGSPVSPEKLKAANFPALSLQIGAWKMLSRYEGDLVAKCYFKKKKLVWEVLDGNLKRKIEFQWSNIIAIRGRFLQDAPAILDIMLEKSPLFFKEVDPQPRKHTNWEQSSDFTNCQASLYKRHTLMFPEGVLEKQYEKLLQADSRLRSLSKQPFPEQASPLFNEIQFASQPSFTDHTIPDQQHLLSDYTATQHQQPNPLGYLGVTSPLSAVDFPVQNSISNFPVDPTALLQHQGAYSGGATFHDVTNNANFQPVSYGLQQEYDYSMDQLQQITATGNFSSADVSYMGFDQSGGWDYRTHSSFGGGAPWL